MSSLAQITALHVRMLFTLCLSVFFSPQLMQTNYHFLCHLTASLRPQLEGKILASCFSQERDELVMGFADQKGELWIKAVMVSGMVGLQCPSIFSRARRNSVDLFPELMDRAVLGVRQYANERCFALLFEGEYALLFKLFGNQSNLIAYQDNQAFSVFRKKLSADLALKLDALDKDLDQSLEAYLRNGLAKTFPTLGKEARQYLQAQGLQNQPPAQQWQMIRDLVSEMEKGDFYISEADGQPVLLLFDDGRSVFHTQDPIAATNAWYQRFTHDYHFHREKQQLASYLNKRIRQSENYIKNNVEKCADLQDRQSYGQMADLLMANLHQISSGSSEVELEDFYHDNKPIRIKLNRQLSPQKNAEQYYRKAKNQRIEIDTLRNNAERKEQELFALLEAQEQLSAAEQLHQVRALRKALGTETQQSQQPSLPYKAFQYQGFDIWVGKHAKSNDELTQRYARKDDLWLHVRGASGSHVVIKQRAGKPFPKEVIEKAASLAAHYSTLKTDTLCPVIVTPRKFVRKPKGSPPGAVVVDKEEVVLVSPAPFSPGLG